MSPFRCSPFVNSFFFSPAVSRLICSTDCMKHNGKLRPEISEVVQSLSEITLDASVEIETPQSQPRDVPGEVIPINLEKSRM